jgi:hypothetical protein
MRVRRRDPCTGAFSRKFGLFLRDGREGQIAHFYKIVVIWM